MSTFKVQTGLRMDEIMYNKLKIIAVKDGRSLNNLVEFILNAYLDQYEKENGEVRPLGT